MRLIISLVLACTLSACHSNYRQAKTDDLGYLPIGNTADLRITINQGVDTSQYRKVLYVSTDMHGVINWYGYQDYVMEAFRQLNFFDEVITREPTLYVNTSPPRPTKRYDEHKFWYDMVDPLSLSDILTQYGPNVLVAKVILRNKTDDLGDLNSFYFQLQLIDPTTSKVLFQGSKQGNSTLGIDMNVINPVLNYAKGYLLRFDPYYVPDREPKRALADLFQPAPPLTTPHSYDKGKTP
jgi:hypothetical protein